MKERIKVFLIAVIFSLPFWWVVNVSGQYLEDFFFWNKMSNNPDFLVSEMKMEEKLNQAKPLRGKEVKSVYVNSEAALSFSLNVSGVSKILFEKNIQKELPIASIAKLMTALVVLDNYDLDKIVTVSQKSINQEGDFGKLVAGKKLSAGYLLNPLLIESSNDAAYSLAYDYEGMTLDRFILLMNMKAEELGMKNTRFFNTTGLDTEESGTELNYSTAKDLMILTEKVLKTPLIMEILSREKYNDYGPELINTNRLLMEMPEVIAGKTGYTEKAGGCLILISEAPKNGGYLAVIVLGASNPLNRFEEGKKLMNWSRESYKW